MATSDSSLHRHPVRRGVAGGTTFAAALLLLTAAIVTLLQGISAVVGDELFVVGFVYTYQLDLTTWGWIHIILAVLLGAIALGLFSGAVWARASAVIIAAVSIVANFLWLPYYPLWSILIITLDLIVIWAVATWDPRPAL
ncbi:hypothetical protein QMK17_17545 [Rhodococcus sp. G-MC3]|uniref:DUF7144 family membrane protein n=1 Tax=Rhodococcus sp. G-MC3 TaxID=3046209 RepID=UPI0024BAD64C|nr:hypothetical protein [Rhodococcus sp. G-MC3]MDJ0395132.1 hypothetical protein [Rhodococcus sp. G-MC3]